MFVGRDRELQMLGELWSKPVSSLIVCRGRRRIGKSRLIQEFAKTAKVFMEFQGLPPRKDMSREDQLKAFAEQLAAQSSIPVVGLAGWLQAFHLLDSCITDKPTVVFLDEISWMAIRDKDFAGALKIAWDTLFKKHRRLVLVLCGSVSSWIDRNILNSTGFVGRVSMDLCLRELPLKDCARFWGKRLGRVSSVEKLKILAVTGGVPRYLEEIQPNRSAEDNIKRLCFSREGLLLNEYEHIFSSVFGRRAATYRLITETLTEGSLELHALCRKAGVERGGSMGRYMDDLVKSGFIARDRSYMPGASKPGRSVRYRLRDNYLRFYLKHIEPRKTQIEEGAFDDISLENIVAWESILGLQLENLILSHLPEVLRALSVNVGRIDSMSPYYQPATKRRRGCQVDLLIAAGRSLYVCEVRFRDRIDGSVIDQVSSKLNRLRIPPGYTVRPVLIHAGAVADSVRESSFFDQILDLDSLLQ